MKDPAAFHWPEGKRAAVSLTFDDARSSQVDRGLPILGRHGVRATFYVSVKAVRARLDDWKAVAAAAHEIGNHSWSHPCTGNFPWSQKFPLEKMTLEDMAEDLDRASEEIEGLLSLRPRTFAYPCGQTCVGRGEGNRSYVPLIAIRFLVGRGFKSEVVNDPLFFDPAIAMGVEADGLAFDGLKALADQSLQSGGWLILAGHEVGEGKRQCVPAEALDAFCAYCQDAANGIWIGTVESIGEYILAHRNPPE